jgi:anti-anti-sigma factor
MTPAFEACVTCCGGSAIVDVRGELDLATAPVVWDEITNVVPASRSLVIDLSAVTFIDSSGLGVLLRAQELLRPAGALLIRGPQPQARRLFELAGVERMLTIEA